MVCAAIEWNAVHFWFLARMRSKHTNHHELVRVCELLCLCAILVLCVVLELGAKAFHANTATLFHAIHCEIYSLAKHTDACCRSQGYCCWNILTCTSLRLWAQASLYAYKHFDCLHSSDWLNPSLDWLFHGFGHFAFRASQHFKTRSSCCAFPFRCIGIFVIIFDNFTNSIIPSFLILFCCIHTEIPPFFGSQTWNETLIATIIVIVIVVVNVMRAVFITNETRKYDAATAKATNSRSLSLSLWLFVLFVCVNPSTQPANNHFILFPWTM